MTKATCISAAAAALLLAACVHDTHYSRSEPVGVNAYSYSSATIDTTPSFSSSPTVIENKSAPVTGAVGAGINPSPSTMGTTTSSGSASVSGTANSAQGATTAQGNSRTGNSDMTGH